MANLMRSFRLEACDKTPSKLELDPAGMLIRPLEGVFVCCVEDELQY